MEIFISEIPEEGRPLEAHVPGEAWFKQIMVEVLKESFAKGDRADLSLRLLRVNRDVDVLGKLRYSAHVECDRCLTRFPVSRTIELQTHLTPLYEEKRKKKRQDFEMDEQEALDDDEDFGFYQGDSFDLAELLREQLELSIPMKTLCQEECQGLCQKCGQNLNFGTCDCLKNIRDERWGPLQELKEKLKKD